MERQNTVLLIVVAVATLLVAVVGATFAYYTATTTNTGAGESGNVTTTTVGNVTLNMSATTTTNKLEYPGGFLVVGALVTGTHTGDTAYNTTYTVNGTINNGTKTQLEWSLYELGTAVAEPVTGCTVKETAASGETRYTYEGCSLNIAFSSTAKVTNGTVAASSNGTVTVPAETLTTTQAGAKTYYYLVVKYPETNENQNADQNATITAALTSISGGTAVVDN